MDFPALAPATRTYTPPESPFTAYTSMSGQQSRVRHSTVLLGGSLELSFVRLEPSDRNAIEHHYRQQFGEFLPFHLPPETFSGFTPLEVDPYGLWRYAQPPEFEDHCGPTATAQVKLVSVPGGAPGAQLGSVALSITSPGAGPGGAQQTVAGSLTAGAASAS